MITPKAKLPPAPQAPLAWLIFILFTKKKSKRIPQKNVSLNFFQGEKNAPFVLFIKEIANFSYYLQKNMA